ncbi:MAG: hypothetical protein JWR69_840 [Pedosphaera sp.]|nr:hypothetical protein [Pedosphaera sp.]
MTSFHKLHNLKAKMILPHFLVSVATSCRYRLAIEAARFRPVAVGLKGWAFPIMDAPVQVAGGTRARSVSEERITPTAIVLLGLAVTLLVAFMVGTESGTLHPVWQAIVGLTGVGMVGMTLRLIQIFSGKVRR